MESNSRNSRHCVPPGFRFHPTDEELVNIYLKNKVSIDNNQPHLNNFHLDHVIPEIDLNKLEPWDLREKCNIDVNSQSIQAPEWYFFSHKDKKYPTGTRTNRATVAGFWKATGRDKAVHSAPDVRLNVSRMIGMRKTLVFYRGRAPHGKKTDWIMHEYRLEDDKDHNAIESKSCNEGGWVVCRVFKKRNLPVSSKATTTTTHEDSKAMKSCNSENVIDTNALSDAEETPLKRRPKKPLRNVRHTREVGVKSDQDADIISSENFPERIKSETTMSDENTFSSCPLIISTSASIFDDGFQLPSLICSNDNNDDDDDDDDDDDEGSDDIEQCDNHNKINGSDNNNRKSINHYDNAFMSDHDNLLELIHNGQHMNVDSLEYGTLTTWSSLYNETSVIATRSNADNINYRLCPDQFCNLPIDNLLIHHPPQLSSLNPLHENNTLSFHKHIMMHDQHNPHDHHDSPYNRLDHYNNIMNPSLYNTSCDQLVDLWSYTI